VLSDAARACRACEFACRSTQTVFGEGPPDAPIVFVGEQPGDVEDIEGRPFVGPAGRLLAEVMEHVGIDRQRAYVTNAVKHFKFEPRGKRRIHQTPSARDVSYCKPWLLAEIEAVKPRMLVALGATAARSLFGASFRITQRRGNPFESEHAPWSFATFHPSMLLRIPEPDVQEASKALFVSDLARVATELRSLVA
jgi:DNA polymerase